MKNEVVQQRHEKVQENDPYSRVVQMPSKCQTFNVHFQSTKPNKFIDAKNEWEQNKFSSTMWTPTTMAVTLLHYLQSKTVEQELYLPDQLRRRM